ncbi:MAG: hypothetical protein DLM54_07500 [Acidimicrobiales bacterium]|nr:MAG: hypothetical protein DLM54_07500 [Acidimicrobiales bacterium]
MCGGCGDIALNSWFLAWTPFAILHGHNPLLSTWANYPHGVNLMDNASMMLPALLVAPVTLALGPLVSFNLLATLAFAGSATAAFFVLRRYAPWPPAAFVGGLLYGFSPYMVNQGLGHIHLTLVAFPPLLMLVLDEVLVRQRRPPIPCGIILGLLVVAQFFTSTEVLASTAIMAAIGVVILLGVRRLSGSCMRRASVSLLVAGVVAVVILAVPLYVLVAGPQHINGPAQPNGAIYSANMGGPIVAPGTMVFSTARSSMTSAKWFGIADIVENGTYLGIPLLMVLALVGLRFRRERLVCFGLAMAAIAFVIALGARLDVGTRRTGIRLPFTIFQHLPLLQSLLAVRFMLYVDLFIGLVLAVGIDRIQSVGFGALKGGLRAGAVATLVGMAALVPLVPRWPYSTQREEVPRWFVSNDVRVVPAGSVVVTYPFGPTPYSPLLWQAQANLRYRIPDGDFQTPGPGGRVTVLPNPTTLQALLTDYYTGEPPPALSASLITQARADLERWNTWAVVVAREGAAPNRAVELFRRVLGEPPTWHDGVAVWTDCPAAPGEHLTGPGSVPPGIGGAR